MYKHVFNWVLKIPSVGPPDTPEGGCSIDEEPPPRRPNFVFSPSRPPQPHLLTRTGDPGRLWWEQAFRQISRS